MGGIIPNVPRASIRARGSRLAGPGLGSSAGQSARLIIVRSGVRVSPQLLQKAPSIWGFSGEEPFPRKRLQMALAVIPVPFQPWSEGPDRVFSGDLGF